MYSQLHSIKMMIYNFASELYEAISMTTEWSWVLFRVCGFGLTLSSPSLASMKDGPQVLPWSHCSALGVCIFSAF